MTIISKKFILILLFLFFTGCLPLTSNSLKKINANDSKDEVIKKIGKPYTTKIYYNKEYLVYYVHDSFFDLFFNAQKFPFVGFYPFLRTGNEYWIIFEDNKVAASGTSKNFSNNVPRALSNKGVVEVIDN